MAEEIHVSAVITTGATTSSENEHRSDLIDVGPRQWLAASSVADVCFLLYANFYFEDSRAGDRRLGIIAVDPDSRCIADMEWRTVESLGGTFALSETVWVELKLPPGLNRVCITVDQVVRATLLIRVAKICFDEEVEINRRRIDTRLPGTPGWLP